jgi:hypothetical protein
MNDPELRAALAAIDPEGRRVLRKYLIADEHDRKGLLVSLYRERSPSARTAAELVELLDADPDTRRQVARVLGEIDARAH